MAWNRPSENQQTKASLRRGGTPRPTVWAVAAIVVLGMGIIGWLLWPSGERGEDAAFTERVSRIKEVKPSPPSKQNTIEPREEEKPKIQGCEAWEKAQGLDPKLFPYDDGRKVIETRTNQWMAVDICIMPNGARRKVRRHVGKQLFKCGTDMVLLQALSTGADEVGPPIPFSADMEEDFIESLKTPIVIEDDDTPEQREAKEMVIAARESVAEQIKEGRSFFDAVNDHLETQRTGQSARETVMEAVAQLKEAGESDLIDNYLEESNKALANMGIGPVLKSDVEEETEEVEEQK